MEQLSTSPYILPILDLLEEKQSEKIKDRLVVFQDGADFYEDSTGKWLFNPGFHIKDWDLRGAQIARREFRKVFPNAVFNDDFDS